MNVYDPLNPPDLIKGENPLWTSEQAEAWETAYRYQHGILTGTEGDRRVLAARQTFESDLFDFVALAAGFSRWVMEIAFEVSGGTIDMPKLRCSYNASWTAFRDNVVAEINADLCNPDYFDEGYDPYAEVETKACLWVFTLEPYRIWQVESACRKAGVAAVADVLLRMAIDDKNSTSYVRRAVRNAMTKACTIMFEEFEASTT